MDSTINHRGQQDEHHNTNLKRSNRGEFSYSDVSIDLAEPCQKRLKKPQVKCVEVCKKMQDLLAMKNFKVDELVWAKADRRAPAWPAVIIDPQQQALEVVLKACVMGTICVMYFSFKSGQIRIIEYRGELIRLSVSDAREKQYQSKNKHCYFFQVSDQVVIDATNKGNVARFINHSCQPNCFARKLPMGNTTRLVFVARENISAGQELILDYMFEVGHE